MSEAAKSPEQKATFGQKVGAMAYRVFCFLLRITNIKVIALFGKALGHIVWLATPTRRRIVERNLRIILGPEKRPHELKTLVRRNMVRTTMNLICTFKTGLLTDKEAEKYIKLEGTDIFRKAGSGNNCAICCVPHAGNWELLARTRPYFKEVEHYGSMYRQLDNPLLEKIVYETRTRYGCEMFSKQKGLTSVLRLVKTGGLLGVLSDQYTAEGLFVPYFGKVTGTTPLPALLYKRSKGRGTLIVVYTSNTALGHWTAHMGGIITVPESSDGSMASITLRVNKALEAAQRKNILDGFWMHHRWKTSTKFGKGIPEEAREEIKAETRMPFRVIICTPEDFAEAQQLLPYARALKACRFDMELTFVCPMEQMGYWRSIPKLATWVIPSDGEVKVFDRLNQDDIYNTGPFDVVMMFSENKSIYKQLRKLMPVVFYGFKSNPVARKKRAFTRNYRAPQEGMPQPRSLDYIQTLALHGISVDEETVMAALPGNEEETGKFIAPFSTLGAADSWPLERWQELVSRLDGKVTLLALEKDSTAAEEMAGKLGISHRCIKPEDMPSVLGTKAHLYAVDGLLPQLAAGVGCPCTVLMGSRLAAKYAPQGEIHKAVTNHKPCHPCYRKDCDTPAHCTAAITVDDVL